MQDLFSLFEPQNNEKKGSNSEEITSEKNSDLLNTEPMQKKEENQNTKIEPKMNETLPKVYKTEEILDVLKNNNLKETLPQTLHPRFLML